MNSETEVMNAALTEADLENKVQKLVDDLDKFKKKFQKKSQATFKKVFRAFWKNHPNIKAVGWTQYTPYFNDGEPCEFGVHDMFPVTSVGLKKMKDDGVSVGWGMEEYVPFGYGNKEGETISREEVESAERFLKMLKTIPDDTYYDMFGDHASILATRKGFEVEQCDHD